MRCGLNVDCSPRELACARRHAGGACVRQGLSAMAVLSMVLAALACQTMSSQASALVSARTVSVDGQQMPAEDRARALVDAGNLAARERHDAQAMAVLLEVVRDFNDTSSYGPAAVSLARLQLDGGDAKAAQATVEGMLLKDPTSPSADDARYLLALAQLRQGDTRAAAPTLKTLVDKLPADQRAQAYEELGGKLAAEGQGTEAARFLSRALEQADAARKPALEAQLVDAVDSAVPFADVRLLQETEAKPGSLLDEVTTFKLARVHMHLHDYTSADAQAARYLERFPKGRFAKPAQQLRASLEARVAVDVKAIGVLLPMTGEYAAYGKRAWAAMKIAMGVTLKAEVPQEPDLDPTTGEAIIVQAKPAPRDEDVVTAPNGLRLIVKDTKGDATRAPTLVRELVEQHHIIALLGDILLDTSLPIALAAEENGIPLVSLSRRDGVPQAGPWSFRLALTARKQARDLAAMAVEGLGMKRFAIMYPRYAFGVELMNAFWDELELRQAEVTAIESYAHDQTTFTPEAKSLVGRGISGASAGQADCLRAAGSIDNEYRRKKAREGCGDLARPTVDFEALFIPDGYRTVSYVIPALVAEDVLVTRDWHIVDSYRKTTGNMAVRPVQLLGVNMWNDPELGKRMGHQIDGAIFVDGFDARDQTPRVQKFVTQFAAAQRSKPQLVEAQAYDAAALLAELLVGASGAPTPRTREGLRTLLSNVKDFPGVTGLICFDDQGDSTTELRHFVVQGESLEARELSKIVGEGKKGDGS